MVHVKLLFYDPDVEDKIQVFANAHNKIYIGINSEMNGPYENSACITLDVETAVKFAKELRRSIALIKEDIKDQKPF